MKKKKGHLIAGTEPGSPAEELGIGKGDRLIAVDGHEIEDVFDYRYYINAEDITLLIEKEDGEAWEYEIENGCEDPGIIFESGLMSDYRSCSNKCIFCFIDQMPKGMRDTLYFKDDDSRLSFLQGNYVTLTNMKDRDLQRIIDFRLEPINISVHTTNPELRVEMLHNRFAGDSLKYLDVLMEHEIVMNGQIVLCKGYNDGPELERTIRDLMKYAPVMQSVSVVPVGLTDYREGLCPLKPIEKDDAADAVRIIESFQEEAVKRFGIHFVHASDEFYLTAGLPLPETERYDGFPQLENGVGMLRLLDDEVGDALECTEPLKVREKVSAVSGMLAAPWMERQMKRIAERFPEKELQLIPVKNRFFGSRITVTGLLTGADVLKGLEGKDLGDRLLLPSCMFRSGEEVFLDDMTLAELEERLGVPCVIIGPAGRDLVDAVNDPDYTADTEYEGYEPSPDGIEEMIEISADDGEEGENYE